MTQYEKKEKNLWFEKSPQRATNKVSKNANFLEEFNLENIMGSLDFKSMKVH